MRETIRKFRASSSDYDPDLEEAIRRSLLSNPAAGSSSNDDDPLLKQAKELSFEEYVQKTIKENEEKLTTQRLSNEWEESIELQRLYENSGVKNESLSKPRVMHFTRNGRQSFSFKTLLEKPVTFPQLAHRTSFIKNLEFLENSGGEYSFLKVKHATCSFYAKQIMKKGFSYGSRHAYGHGVYFSDHEQTLTKFGIQACDMFKRLHPEVNVHEAIPCTVTALIVIPNHKLIDGKTHMITNFKAPLGNITLQRDNNMCCTLVMQRTGPTRQVTFDDFLEAYKRIDNIKEEFYIVVDDMNLILPLYMEEIK